MSNELATTSERRGATAFEPQSFTELVRFAEYICVSELVPRHLRDKPKDIVLIALRAKELGIPMVSAMSMIYLVEGRVSLSAELWVAIVKRHPECEYFRLVESTDERAVYECKRRGSAPVRLEYTIAQATKAKLASKGTWTSHPAAMLRARASTALARAEFPDAALGMLEHDEAEEITGKPVPVDVRVVDAPASPRRPSDLLPEGAQVPQVIADDLAAYEGQVTLGQGVCVFVDHEAALSGEDRHVAFDACRRAVYPAVSVATFEREVADERAKRAALKRPAAALVDTSGLGEDPDAGLVSAPADPVAAIRDGLRARGWIEGAEVNVPVALADARDLWLAHGVKLAGHTREKTWALLRDACGDTARALYRAVKDATAKPAAANDATGTEG